MTRVDDMQSLPRGIQYVAGASVTFLTVTAAAGAASVTTYLAERPCDVVAPAAEVVQLKPPRDHRAHHPLVVTNTQRLCDALDAVLLEYGPAFKELADR